MCDVEAIRENTLEVIAPDRLRHVAKIAGYPFLIGRGGDTGNHLRLDDPRISRQCASIISDGKRCLLEDRGHRRGVFVNGNTPAAAGRYIITVVQLKLGAAPSTRTGHIAGLAPLPRDPRASTVRVGGDARPRMRR
jgi:FHA domain